MTRRNEFVEWLAEQLELLGKVTGRAMFGGWGVYCDGLIFAIVVDEVLYLKADAETIPAFAAAACGPFGYVNTQGKLLSLSYYRIPDEVLEERHELLVWSRAALGAALRAKAAKAPKRGKHPAD